MKSNGKPKGHAKNPPISTRHMATTRVAPPLCIKYDVKSQESLTNQGPLIFYGFFDMSQRPQNLGASYGIDEIGYRRDKQD